MCRNSTKRSRSRGHIFFFALLFSPMPAEKMSEKRKKLRRPRRSSEDSDDSSSSESSFLTSSSSDEETDAKDLKPIKEYMTDRKELASQLLKSVKQEKIVMMLPQTLRKVDLSDLEELCASELTGMSKTRILSIINGKEIMESSNTDDTDDSGPSLEIISDTEWLSDDDIGIKVEGGNSKNSKDGRKSKKKSEEQKKQEANSKLKSKVKGKVGKDGKTNVAKVKLEKVKTEKVKTEKKEKQKEKEGESLLDLLELEMRARAIRALIRKEEGTSISDANSKPAEANSSASTASTSGTSSDSNAKKRQANLKEQLEKIDVLMKHGDDEDVFVVIQPAPTIELLSTDSENEDHSKRINQRLVSERKSESENVQEKVQFNKDKNNLKDNTKEKEKMNENKKDTTKGKDFSKDKGQGQNSKKVQKENENFNLPMSVSESNVETLDKPEKSNEPPKEEELEEGEIIDNDDEVVNEKETEKDKETDKEKEKPNDSSLKNTIKKVKRNTHIRSRKRSKASSDSSTNSDDDVTPNKKMNKSDDENNSNNKDKDMKIADEPIEIEESPIRKDDSDKAVNLKETKADEITNIDLDDDKSLDIEEIINLDDYPDDIEDLEKSDSTTSNKEAVKATDSNNKGTDNSKDESSTSISRSETWASRYYQQDDVQNVIKESKIQSEIRKRLRERQRQSKLNNSPKLKEQTSESSSESMVPKPTGSVEEYLALKGLSSETSSDAKRLDDSASNDSTNLGEDSQSSSESRMTVEVPAVIVKKAKLNENAAVVKRTESSVFESLHKVLKCEDSPSDKSGVVIKHDLMLTDKKVVVVKAPEMLETAEPSGNVEENVPVVVPDDSKSQEQTAVVEKKGEARLSPIRDDGGTPKSDSSEDNVIVKIGDTSSTTEKLIDASSQEASEQIELTGSSDPASSELRPV